MTFLNVGPFDRVIRILVGVALAMLAWIAWPGTLAVLFAVAAGIALVTGIVGWQGTRCLAFQPWREHATEGMPHTINLHVAGRLDEAASFLASRVLVHLG